MAIVTIHGDYSARCFCATQSKIGLHKIPSFTGAKMCESTFYVHIVAVHGLAVNSNWRFEITAIQKASR